MRHARGLTLNYFGPGAVNAALPSGNVVNINVDTDYPRGPQVNISISPAQPENFELAVRIPHWSQLTAVRLNGVPVQNVVPGQYLRIRRLWEPGDALVIHFDFRLQFWHNPSIGFLPEATDFVAQWQIFGPIPRTPGLDVPNVPPDFGLTPSLDGLSTPPPVFDARNTAYKPTLAISRGGILDITHMFPDADRLGAAIAFTSINAEEDDELPIIFGCDWWAQVYVNGEKIYDNTIDRVDLPTLAASNLTERIVTPDHWQDAWLLVEYPTTRFGVSVRLCDFASAGFAGHAYSTWLPVRFVSPPIVPFTRDNPLRAFRQTQGPQNGML
jgi:hypothetical protein